MNTIPVIASDKEMFSTISKITKSSRKEIDEVIYLEDALHALDFLNSEMSELIFINFSDKKIDAFDLLNNVMSDPWLFHCGIIAVCDNIEDRRRIENIRGANIIVDLDYEDLKENLSKVLSIIFNNRRIIFQRGIGSDIVSYISGSFKLDNDPLEAKCYVNLICNFLHNSNKLGAERKFDLQLALNEMLLNAVEHGNCRINYEEKTKWLEKHGSIIGLIKKRRKDPEVAAKRVTFEYAITPNSAKFFIADEGEGFNWREVKDVTKEENLLELHGRGILMTKNVAENLVYNDKGNEVSFEIGFEKDVENITPSLFVDMKSKDVKPGDVIFREGEPSNFLYYIVKGRYSVVVGGKIVSMLSADDIFMGEMSFLLNNRRSAAVQALSFGKLIEVSKGEFVEAIKKRPHYALFLARLLAQRIQRLNRIV